MTSEEINRFIKKHSHLGNQALSKKLGLTRSAIESRRKRIGAKFVKRYKANLKAQIEEDSKLERIRKEKQDTDKKYQSVIKRNQELEALLGIKEKTKHFNKAHIIPSRHNGSSEATAVVVASDWHIEEVVNKATVNGLNEFNSTIAKQRVDKFFQNTLRLIEIYRKDIKIDTLVLALLGDFISNGIHEELAESNDLLPIQAIREAQGMIASGIQFLLDNSNLNLVIPCHSGNHGRITKKQRISTEAGNSLEYLMYLNLTDYFKDNDRVKFIVSEGYLSYLKVYDYTLRFHHGHAIKYGGGIGGIFVPAFKAIGQWDKSQWADIDIFGHFHQFKFGGNFICNGSLIGYNAYALSIKADFEKPSQSFFLINKNHGLETFTKIRL